MTEFLDAAVTFAKEKIDRAMEIWDSFDEEKKKMLIGCAAVCVGVIVLASVFYGLGKARGKKIALMDEDF
ncbi:MAG: hypothetical protein J6O61_05530 [Butyrivibrio sp.]|uniref:hypothetical protein n=1 Tax=Butyrivibrio sp. TaxID=28121 RepID=UPI001B1205C4|nr:hypothetical protein [Butyrivibrio sp.]MBO6240287.1 hypothetical protein [Butyrivibrio sp.]